MMLLHLALVGLGAVAQVNGKKVQDVFTPKDMLSAPRPQPAIAAPGGAHAVSVVDQWDPKHDSIERRVYLVALNTKSSEAPVPLFNTTSAHASQFLWLDSSTIAYLNGSVLHSFNVNYTIESSGTSLSHQQPVEILTFPSGVNPAGLQFEPESGVLGFSGVVWENDGDFFNTPKLNEKWENRGDSGLVFDDLFVRHWDEWRTPGRVWTLGVTKLAQKAGVWTSAYDKQDEQFINVFDNAGLYSQFDPISSFSLSPKYIAGAIKTPHLNVATHTREDIYLVSLPTSFTKKQSSPSPKHLTPHVHGAISGVTFSPDGKKIAWLEMAKDGYESDKRVVVVHEVGKKAKRWTDQWDRSPASLWWSLDSESVYFTAEHHGRILPYHLSHPDHLPTPLYFNGSTSSITQLTNYTLLISQHSLTSPSDDYILTLPDPNQAVQDADGDSDGDKLPRDLRRLTAWSAEHIGDKLEGLQGEEFWFKGAEDKDVMGWAIRPRGWQEGGKKVWPMAFVIHGGPQSAWGDSWSTRWNMAVFASQGYFTIFINPTGSTGYGQDFTDAIQNNWGGRPYKDLLAGYHAALKLYPEIDPDRTAGLGGSYGGYMVNYINGHNEPFGFKALVCHDGLFDTVSAYFSTEEVWFPTQEFGGSPLTHRGNYEKWNPVNFAQEWTTPQLIIQGGKDYRLENSQGIGPFTALQIQGVPSRFLYFDDENHWVLKPHNSMKWHHEVFRWIHEWVGKVSDDGSMASEEDEQKNIDIGGRFHIQT